MRTEYEKCTMLIRWRPHRNKLYITQRLKHEITLNVIKASRKQESRRAYGTAVSGVVIHQN